MSQLPLATNQGQTRGVGGADPSAFAVARPNQGAVAEYVPFGGTEKIKLTVKIIQDLIAVPTRSGKTCSDRDAMKFLMLCRSRALDPFEGDCFLIGYDANDGATFSLITAHQAFLKRAECHPEYDGMESGLVISPAYACPQCSAEGGRAVNGNWVICSACKGIGQTDEIEGDIIPEEHQIVGGWARVHFKNRKIPMKKRVSLRSFAKGFGRWKDDTAGMIVKCAEADALRSSFPTKLGGLYLREEQEIQVTSARVDVPTDLDAAQGQVQNAKPARQIEQPAQPSSKPEPTPTTQQPATSEAPATPAAAKKEKAAAKKEEVKTKPLVALRNVMTLEGIKEMSVIEYCVRKQGITPPPNNTLDELGEIAHNWLLTNWETVSTQIHIDEKEAQ